MAHNALRLCEVPKKNRAKRGFFFGILQNRSCTKDDRRENFVQLWCSRSALYRRRAKRAFCTTFEYCCSWGIHCLSSPELLLTKELKVQDKN